MFVLYLYLTLINAASFVLMLTDKRRAQKKKRRIPEDAFFNIAILGGSIGILLGMRAFRHKTRHTSFTAGIPAILAVQILLGVILYSIIK